MRTVLFLLAFLVLQVSAYSDDMIDPRAHGAKIRVPEECYSIQKAIKKAANGATIIVSAGTYRENIDFLGKAITLKSEDGPGSTIIDGCQNGSVVQFTSGEGMDSVLDGFTVTNGYGMAWARSAGDGGGIYCDGASPLIINNIITDNFASSGYGGGLFIKSYSAPFVVYNTIEDNCSQQCGGGIYCRNSTPYIVYNTISNNKAMLGFGGGITCSLESQAYILNNTMVGNWSKAGAGGICAYQSSPFISGNVVAKNTTLAAGGGILVFWNSSSTISNNTITKNDAQEGGGVACMNYSTATVSNSIIWDNNALKGREVYVGKSNRPASITVGYTDLDITLGAIFSDTNCQINLGGGNISTDPFFVNPAKNDFHLTIYSPCINVGDNSTTTTPYKDVDGNPRIAPLESGTTDMGADEFYHHVYTRGSAQAGGEIDLVTIGYPTLPAILYIRPILPDLPGGGGSSNQYAFWNQWNLGPIPMSGVLNQTISVPSSALPGDRFRIFVLEGYFGFEPLFRTEEIELTID